MGNYEYSMNVFICGDLTDVNKNIINSIFEQKGDKSHTKFEPRDYDFDIIYAHNKPLENYDFYWVGHLFNQEISDELIQNIGKGIQIMNNKYYDEKNNNIDIRRNNVILCFLMENENSDIIENPIKSMNKQYSLIEAYNPIIITVGGNNIDEDFEKLKLINRLPGGNENDILRNVQSKLLTVDAYLNERGNIFDKIVYRNLGKFNEVTATTYLDILIFGGSRTGKSTFINTLSNSLLAREQTNSDTCTTKCTEYVIPFENIENNHGENHKDNLLNQALAEINRYTGKLKIIDTPGLFNEQDVSKVCKCLEKYISEEIEIIQLALFFIKDNTNLINAKDIFTILIKYDIPIFFVITHCDDENKRIEETKIYNDIRCSIAKFDENSQGKLLIQKRENGKDKIYNFIRINQKIDVEHKTIFGVDILLEKILHFFLYEKLDELIKNDLKEDQNFIQQKNILASNLSDDLSSNFKKFSLHDVLFRSFSTLADVTNYFYRKSNSLVVAANFAVTSSCLIPIPFADLPLYYAIHAGLVLSILSVFGIKIKEVNIKTIMLTNGTNLGGKYSRQWTVEQIVNIGIKIALNLGKLAGDVAGMIPFLGIVGRGADITFSVIDTNVFGNNLIASCDKLPKNQQFFLNELKKFYYILNKLDEIRIRIKNEHNN